MCMDVCMDVCVKMCTEMCFNVCMEMDCKGGDIPRVPSTMSLKTTSFDRCDGEALPALDKLDRGGTPLISQLHVDVVAACLCSGMRSDMC